MDDQNDLLECILPRFFFTILDRGSPLLAYIAKVAFVDVDEPFYLHHVYNILPSFRPWFKSRINFQIGKYFLKHNLLFFFVS